MKIKRKNKIDVGSMLLEVILVIGIIIIIFPLMTQNINQRSEDIRNELIVRDMNMLREAAERYFNVEGADLLSRGMSIGDIKEYSGKCCQFAAPGSVCARDVLCDNIEYLETSLDNLIPAGLSPNFRTHSVLGNQYVVKLMRLPDACYGGCAPGEEGTPVFGSIVVALESESVNEIRARRIVRESFGFGGYVEDGIIWGANWSLAVYSPGPPPLNWNNRACDLEPTVENLCIFGNAIVFNTATSDANDYIHRFDPARAIMKTNLYMNKNQIMDARNVNATISVETNILLVAAGSDEPIDETTAVFEGMIIGKPPTSGTDVSLESLFPPTPVRVGDGEGSVIFPEGIQAAGLSLAGIGKVLVEGTITTAALLANYGRFRWTSADTLTLRPETVGNMEMSVGNLIEVDASLPVHIQRIGDPAQELPSMYIHANNTKMRYSDLLIAPRLEIAGREGEYHLRFDGGHVSFSGEDLVIKDIMRDENPENRRIGGSPIHEEMSVAELIRLINKKLDELDKLVKDRELNLPPL
ncbi:MAG: hypothetical protein FWD15_02550 [Alphaproteobacteria bacterium]|nr:hypothetical protein [Alphaproteobacteria bacterium]